MESLNSNKHYKLCMNGRPLAHLYSHISCYLRQPDRTDKDPSTDLLPFSQPEFTLTNPVSIFQIPNSDANSSKTATRVQVRFSPFLSIYTVFLRYNAGHIRLDRCSPPLIYILHKGGGYAVWITRVLPVLNTQHTEDVGPIQDNCLLVNSRKPLFFQTIGFKPIVGHELNSRLQPAL